MIKASDLTELVSTFNNKISELSQDDLYLFKQEANHILTDIRKDLQRQSSTNKTNPIRVFKDTLYGDSYFYDFILNIPYFNQEYIKDIEHKYVEQLVYEELTQPVKYKGHLSWLSNNIKTEYNREYPGYSIEIFIAYNDNNIPNTLIIKRFLNHKFFDERVYNTIKSNHEKK